MKKGDNTELEVLRLRRAISGIINDVCISRNCPNRKYLNDVRIHEILKGDDSETE